MMKGLLTLFTAVVCLIPATAMPIELERSTVLPVPAHPVIAQAEVVQTSQPDSQPTEAPPTVDFSSPEATFQTLLDAVRVRNLDTYRQCFSQAAIESGEAQLELAQAAPEPFWAELEALFRGPQNLTIRERSEEFARGYVDAPEAARGGIGGLTFVFENGGWRIRTW